MSKTILIILFTFTLLISACGSPEITYTPPPIETEEWSLRMTQSGGIAGINRTVEILSDGSYTLTDERNNQNVTKELSKEQLSELQTLISALEFHAPQSRSGCADCFEYAIEIESGGKKMIFNADDVSLPDSGAGELVTFLQKLFE